MNPETAKEAIRVFNELREAVYTLNDELSMPVVEYIEDTKVQKLAYTALDRVILLNRVIAVNNGEVPK